MDATGYRRQYQAREDISPPVENTVALGQPQDPRYDDTGYYDMAYDYPPPHGHRDHDVADYTGLARDNLIEAQVNQPARVCTANSLPIQISDRTLYQRTSTHSTTQGSMLQLALLKPSSTNGLAGTSFLMDQPLNTSRGSQSTTCTSQIYKFP